MESKFVFFGCMLMLLSLLFGMVSMIVPLGGGIGKLLIAVLDISMALILVGLTIIVSRNSFTPFSFFGIMSVLFTLIGVSYGFIPTELFMQIEFSLPVSKIILGISMVFLILLCIGLFRAKEFNNKKTGVYAVLLMIFGVMRIFGYLKINATINLITEIIALAFLFLLPIIFLIFISKNKDLNKLTKPLQNIVFKKQEP